MGANRNNQQSKSRRDLPNSNHPIARPKAEKHQRVEQQSKVRCPYGGCTVLVPDDKDPDEILNSHVHAEHYDQYALHAALNGRRRQKPAPKSANWQGWEGWSHVGGIEGEATPDAVIAEGRRRFGFVAVADRDDFEALRRVWPKKKGPAKPRPTRPEVAEMHVAGAIISDLDLVAR